MDEEYFVHTLLPLAVGSVSGNAAYIQFLRKYEADRNRPLAHMVLEEFRQVVRGVHLPSGRIAKLVDSERFHDVLWKIIRGLHFHHTGEIMHAKWDIRYTITPYDEDPPEAFKTYAEAYGDTERGAVRGAYPQIFAYVFDIFPDAHDLHWWAFRLWDRIIITAAFHDMNCKCEHCEKIGPLLPVSRPGTIKVSR